MKVRVFVEADFVADFNAVDVDPGFGYVRLDFALEVGMDAIFEGYAFAIAQVDSEAAIDDCFAVFDVLSVGGPTFAVGRVREHEVKARAEKFIGGEGGAAFDVGRVVAFDHHVGFADGVGLVVDFFTVDVALGPDGALVDNRYQLSIINCPLP